MKQEQRNLAWCCLASAVAHGALIFLIAVNFKSVPGTNSPEYDSKENGSQEIDSEIVSVELLSKPADVKQEEKQSEAGASETEVMVTDAANSPQTDSQDCPNFFGGIGMEYQFDGLVTNVPGGYPAARAGILPGDILKGDTKYIRGEIGTAVNVVVIRGKKTLKFSMIREKICVAEEGKIKR